MLSHLSMRFFKLYKSQHVLASYYSLWEVTCFTIAHNPFDKKLLIGDFLFAFPYDRIKLMHDLTPFQVLYGETGVTSLFALLAMRVKNGYGLPMRFPVAACALARAEKPEEARHPAGPAVPGDPQRSLSPRYAHVRAVRAKLSARSVLHFRINA